MKQRKIDIIMEAVYNEIATEDDVVWAIKWFNFYINITGTPVPAILEAI